MALTRRGFISAMLSGGLLGSAGTMLDSPRAYASSSSALASPQELPAGGDWKEDSRWGLEHWRVNRQAVEWPNRARTAFLCSVPFESYDLGEGPARDSASVSNVFYGGKAGVWRIMDILDRHGIKGSFITNAFCAVQFPEAVKAIAERGHEIVGHFWANNIDQDNLSVDRDRELIRRSLSTLEQAAGKRPVAWVAPGWRLGPKSLEILAEEGLNCHANSPSSADLPYVTTVAGKKMVVIVQETILNDNGFFNNFNAPSTFVDYLKRDFDRKYAEGATRPALFNFVLHAQLGGRPFMADALDEIITYVKSHAEVWFATRQQIVDWWLQKNYG